MTSGLVKKLFERAGKLYSQTPETFYVSENDLMYPKSTGGAERTYMQAQVTQPYVQKSFTEYKPGNIPDVELIYQAHKKGIFKSFFCTMCAIDKPNNVLTQESTTESLETEPI